MIWCMRWLALMGANGFSFPVSFIGLAAWTIFSAKIKDDAVFEILLRSDRSEASKPLTGVWRTALSCVCDPQSWLMQDSRTGRGSKVLTEWKTRLSVLQSRGNAVLPKFTKYCISWRDSYILYRDNDGVVDNLQFLSKPIIQTLFSNLIL